jgi:hypothetical protein
MALEGNLSTFADQALAAFLATAVQNRATSFGGHASTETMLLLAGALGRTIGRAHDSNDCVIE